MMKLAAAPDPEIATSDTLSERAANLLERDIVSGELPPGSKLGIVELARRYEIGATPLREGLSRLTSRGLIVAIGQRGFRVAEVSRDDLLDITRMRTVIEREALRLAIDNGGDAWEAGIVAALHQMQRYVERNANDFREGAPEFDRLHKAFHTSLLAACGSPRLLAAHSDLYDQAYRYRRVMMRSIESGRYFIAAHRELADLVLARDAEAAETKLDQHLRATLTTVYPPGKSQPPSR
ncbi:HTH-type transcriptional repressor GlaR [Rhodopseudomonas palustris]|uniref:FCD domain-containing protein n=1 Tax=Rhodopseudomonas palustris (strain ATCC BAA-98 / CGA009) TaxID=258594 RepID=Q6N495_RHOPA|nr:FCD domain-containing protein [Rhodopseudomonas palustris]OPF96667.1 GntR family transcriptional regulator [Rhodopseudomonas palustris]QQM04985.1 HTH-type transcriptional repressor GlaR [Rhodopseudomonas palustris]RJF65117.1 FCD domain-containing protein [Rhodopseudomonas palustris]WAB76344.1 FCD domain-containing protein [Rhodopseudomonas palustris]WCL93614.1 FCD domain-containing protein [Rhodopseudomonas palustris CGA009]